MFKAIRWSTATLVAVMSLSGVAMAQQEGDSLLEKALAPEKKEAVLPADDEATPPVPPAQGQPAIGAPAAKPVPNVAGPAVGGAVADAVVATPAPRLLFLPGAAIGPFGEPIPFASPEVCVGEALLLKGAGCGAPIGRVVMQVDRLIFDAEIVEWADNGVSILMPTVVMLGPTHGMIHVLRADGVLADTLPIVLLPAR